MKLVFIILTLCFFSCNAAKKITSNKTITIQLDGSKSYDPDGFLAWVKWEQISGPSSTIMNPNILTTTAIASTTGVRIYKLTGCDNMGAIRSDTVIKATP